MEPPDLNKLRLEDKFKAKLVRTLEGTFGLVYVFENQGQFPKYFACKTINPAKLENIPEKRGVERVVHEIKQWFNYGHHALILTPLYLEVFKGWPFIVMPYCEGGFREQVEAKTQDVVEAFILGAQMYKALLFARSRGLVAHQDLKPENVLMQNLSKRYHGFPPARVHTSLKWRVRLSDFGLANAWNLLGLRQGSRPYMPPEQYEGTRDFSKVDAYATGVIMTELITGKHPIGEHTSNLWPKVKEGFPRKYEHEGPWKKFASSDKKIDLSSDVPRDTRAIIKASMDADPNNRPELESVYLTLMKDLRLLSPDSSEQLRLLLEHYDNLAEEERHTIGTKEYGRVQLMSKISSSGRFSFVIEQEMRELEEGVEALRNLSGKDSFEVMTLLYDLSLLGELYLKRGKNREALATTVEMSSILTLHHQDLRVGLEWPGTEKVRHIEVVAEYVGRVKWLFRSIGARNELSRTVSLFSHDKVLNSAQLLEEAITTKEECESGSGHYDKAINLLKRAKEQNPNETVFDELIQLWQSFDKIRRATES